MICRHVFLLFLSLAVCLAVAADSHNTPLTGKDVYNYSKNAMESLTYSARRVLPQAGNDDSAEQIAIQYSRPDGVVCKYSEIRGNAPSITIKNTQGEFRLFPDTKQAIKQNISSEEKQVFDLMSNATFSIKSGSWKGIDCWIVTGTSNPTSKQIDEIMKMQFNTLSSGARVSRSDVKKHLQRKEFFFIAKDNYFLWKHDVFTKSGHLISSLQWDEVDFSPRIDESIFNIPATYSMEIAQGFSDSFKRETALREARVENRSKDKTERFNLKNKHVFSLKVLEKLIWLVFSISVILLIVLKIKEKQKKKYEQTCK